MGMVFLTSGHSERQSALMSKITNDGLVRSGTGCLYPYCNSGRQAGARPDGRYDMRLSRIIKDYNRYVVFLSYSRFFRNLHQRGLVFQSLSLKT